jgi:ribonuclease P protein component
MHFALHYRPNGLSDARIGFVIPKKQARSAVLRNAVKRQARELFRQRRSGLPPLDLVLRLSQPLGPAGKVRLVIDRQAKVAWRTEISALLDKLCRHDRKVGP